MSRPMVRTAARTAVRAALVGASVAVGPLLAAPAATASGGLIDGDETGAGLTLVQTLLLYVVAPAVIFALIVLLVVGPSLGKGPRHRTGAALGTGPIWVDPAGVQRTPADPVTPVGLTEPGATDQGGASARW